MGLLATIKADRLINQVLAAGDLDSAASVQAIDKLRDSGKGPIPKIIAMLGTTYREEADTVVDLLTRLVDRPTLQPYLDALSDTDSRVVSGVAQALTRAHNIDPNRFLDLLDNPGVSKPALLEVLSAHKDTLRGERLLRHASQLQHNEVVMLFRIIEDIASEAMIPHLISRIDARDPLMRAQVVRVLSKFRAESAHEALHRALSDENKGVRLAALEGLSKMGGSMDVEQLCRLIKDPDLRIQSKAIDAIVKLNHPRTVHYLLDPLQDESENARRAAVEVLNEIGNVNAIKDLLIAIKDNDWWVRSRAADALGRIGGKKVVDAVIQLIKDKDEYVRRSAIEIINATKDERTYDALVEALGDADWWVRERAVDGLAELGNQKAIPVLIKLLNKESANVQMVALLIKALAKLGAKEAIEPIIERLSAGSETVQREALQALGELADESEAPMVMEAIKSATEDAETEVRQHANKVMQQLQRLLTAKPPTVDTPAPAQVSEEDLSRAQLGTIVVPGKVSRAGGSFTEEELDPSKLQPGDVLGDRYRFIRQVGKGAFGSVYLMEDLMVQEELILKFLNPQLASDETIIKRFVYELRFARKITHPNVIRIYDMLSFGRSMSISMEYFPSHTLSGEMPSRAPMAVEQAVRIIRDVCTGMSSAHRASVVHRDLKPSNILINDEGVVKIVDFGVAAATSKMDTRLTRTGLLIGTPTYMAPEQVLGRDVDSRTDIYSLGVIMYEMFTGRPPYAGGDSMAIMYQHVQGNATQPKERNPELPHTLNAVVLKSMAAEPDKRYQTMEELRERLDAFVNR
jgi:HEAT repeat protein/tRNA A-37 threonylcarbamoyl transferase component Bud32